MFQKTEIFKQIKVPEKGEIISKITLLRGKKVATKISHICCRRHLYVDVFKKANKFIDKKITLQRPDTPLNTYGI